MTMSVRVMLSDSMRAFPLKKHAACTGEWHASISTISQRTMTESNRTPNKALLEDGLWTDAVVTGRGYGYLYHYREGLRTVIGLIIKTFVEGGRDAHAADTLVYPLGFLARHLVELQLKEVYRYLVGQPPDIHGLVSLWDRLRPQIEARWSTANLSTYESYGHLPEAFIQEFGIVLRSEGALDRVGALVAALDELDPKSFSFRYPGTVPPTVRQVSLEKLAAAALEVAEHLDGILTAVDEEESARAEMEAEAPAEP